MYYKSYPPYVTEANIQIMVTQASGGMLLEISSPQTWVGQRITIPASSAPSLVIPRMEDHKVRNTALKFHLLRVLQGLSLPVLRTWPLSFWLSSSAGVVDLGQTLSLPLPPFSLREGHLLALLLHLPRGQDLL